ncbi:pimeloyl-ACP methyl ester carboxylesterase [Paraburkholderia bannensis]|uniref:Pimeloyl-ACP methyl ester carboxylesterase n=1 Tax=Paraburkholderia bannensis TaxID=765414 RepID=A0A7W9WWB9_9BURK|nr:MULTISPECIES: alpha/beta hydrolase [Paraburkholderia]MBB3261250.1 pimeloyl-ACP methyl ester carboxylesterase [Paraburkholderia sp. WP4_3_2]MBB6106287.1 pimeloyl-ACP methyl ester carboxylesterase [Paraburkholderia bannensis]
MIADVAGKHVYAYTGGRAFDPACPTVVFVHGAQHDHSVWGLQSRYFAHHGFSVLAVDLPGHMRSAGPALTSIGALADWLDALLRVLQVEQAIVVGHSMGSLVALEFAARYPARAKAVALLATAFPMTVSPALLEAAREREPEAIELVNAWSHSTLAAKPSSPGPGFWLRGMNQRLMERVAARGEPELFHTDFAACNAYAEGLASAAKVSCPARLIVGKRDLMTPPRASAAIAKVFKDAGVRFDTVTLDAGHALMTEQPDATLDSLYDFAVNGPRVGNG